MILVSTNRVLPRLCAAILFKFQWHVENDYRYFGLGPGLTSISTGSSTVVEINPEAEKILINQPTEIWKDPKWYNMMHNTV